MLEINPQTLENLRNTDAKRFIDIHPSRGLHITGKVVEFAGLPSKEGPLPCYVGRKVHSFTLLSHASLVDIFLYDEFAEKCQNIMEGDIIHIRGPSSIVYDADTQRNLENDSYGRNFIPYSIGIACKDSPKPLSFRVSVNNKNVDCFR